MRFSKFFALTLLLGIFTIPSLYSAVDRTDEQISKDFIRETGNDVIKILINKSIPLTQRQEQFRQVIREKFDMRSIGKFVLGRYWTQANEQQQNEYLQLFEDSIVESYSHQFDSYTNEQLKIIGARLSSKGGVVVTSQIIRSGGTAPLQVDWKVFKTKNGLRILDVFVNGVSMSITYRTEYANIYNSNGGMSGFLNKLRSKEVMTDLPSTD